MRENLCAVDSARCENANELTRVNRKYGSLSNAVHIFIYSAVHNQIHTHDFNNRYPHRERDSWF